MQRQKVRVQVLERWWSTPRGEDQRRGRWARIEVAGLSLTVAVDRDPRYPSRPRTVMVGGYCCSGRRLRDVLETLATEARRTGDALGALGFGGGCVVSAPPAELSGKAHVDTEAYARAAVDAIEGITQTLAYLDDAGARMSQCWIDLHDYREQLRMLVQLVERGDDDLARRSEAWASLDGAVQRARAEDADTAAFYAEPLFDDERDEEVSPW